MGKSEIESTSPPKKRLFLRSLEDHQPPAYMLSYKDLSSEAQHLNRKYQIAINTLDSVEADDTIELIQAGLRGDEVVGLSYGLSHYEVVLITKSQIIKPIMWPNNGFKIKRPVYEPNLVVSNTTCPHAVGHHNQACGTIGLLSLKDLLKNNAQQLKEYTLSFQYYTEQGNKKPFFFCSPQVLRYSQSTQHCESMKSRLLNDLKPVLDYSLKTAQKNNETALIEHYQNILAQLPEFQKKCLANYDEAMVKRNYFSKGKKNHYLLWSSKRIQQTHIPQQN